MILAMACSLAASAYIPLVREGVKWVYFEEYDDSPDNGYYSKGEYAMEVFGDSVVNGVTYKKVFDFPLHQTIDYNTAKPYALVREANKVVYILFDPEMNIDPIGYEHLLSMFGDIPMVKGFAENEWVLYDFNNINRPFSNISNLTPEYTYSGTTEVGGETVKMYTGNGFISNNIIEGIGYVGFVGSCYGNWVLTTADYYANFDMIGYPMSHSELSYLADAEGNVLYKGPAYTKMCDVNDDKKVDGSDLNLLINAVLTGNKRYNYDANGDSAVDGADINEVINFILGN